MVEVSGAPLCTTALWKSPRAAGIAQRSATAAAPADSPKIVTSSGSPPKAAPFACTQRSASTQSSMPQFAHGRAVARRQVGVAEEPEQPEAVVDRDDDHVARAASVVPS